MNGTQFFGSLPKRSVRENEGGGVDIPLGKLWGNDIKIQAFSGSQKEFAFEADFYLIQKFFVQYFLGQKVENHLAFSCKLCCLTLILFV